MARTSAQSVLPSPSAQAEPVGDASTIIRMWGTRRVPGGGHALVEVVLPLDVAVQYMTRDDQPDPMSWVIPRIVAAIAKEVDG